MDLTQRYISMCDDEDVQRPFLEDKAELEDNIKRLSWAYLFTDGYGNRITGIYTGIDEDDPNRHHVFLALPVYNSARFWIQNLNKVIWLPTQAQSQEIYQREPATTFDILDDFNDFWRTEAKYKYQFSSMEQLWLAFLMKTKFSKEWEYEKWVRIS